jgi:glycosyltransferase involved in cell wall biosynthesis
MKEINYDRVFVVMPAYNAGKTLRKTFNDIPNVLKPNVILVDDFSTDDTCQVAISLGISLVRHSENLGYGANQKTCYKAALERGAEIIIMIHPDFQYDARVATILADIIRLGICDIVLGNRIRTRFEALQGGMPVWKYFINRLSTLFENLVLGQSLGDYHSGLRAYSASALRKIPFNLNSDDFAFDQEVLIQAIAFKLKVGDVPVPVRYFEEASSINFRRSLRYGASALSAIISFQLDRLGLRRDARFRSSVKSD